MKRLLGPLLALAGIALAVYGVVLFGDSGTSASVLGMDLSMQDNDMRMQSYLFIGLGIVTFVGGIMLARRS